jgi:hypothetical protein
MFSHRPQALGEPLVEPQGVGRQVGHPNLLKTISCERMRGGFGDAVYQNVATESSEIHKVQQLRVRNLLILQGVFWAEHLVPNPIFDVVEVY